MSEDKDGWLIPLENKPKQEIYHKLPEDVLRYIKELEDQNQGFRETLIPLRRWVKVMSKLKIFQRGKFKESIELLSTELDKALEENKLENKLLTNDDEK